jgi:hypothetical protein
MVNARRLATVCLSHGMGTRGTARARLTGVGGWAILTRHLVCANAKVSFE